MHGECHNLLFLHRYIFNEFHISFGKHEAHLRIPCEKTVTRTFKAILKVPHLVVLGWLRAATTESLPKLSVAIHQRNARQIWWLPPVMFWHSHSTRVLHVPPEHSSVVQANMNAMARCHELHRSRPVNVARRGQSSRRIPDFQPGAIHQEAGPASMRWNCFCQFDSSMLNDYHNHICVR